MPSGIVTLIIVTGSMLALFVIITTVGNNYSLNQIKNKTVGQGQHGTAVPLQEMLLAAGRNWHSSYRIPPASSISPAKRFSVFSAMLPSCGKADPDITAYPLPSEPNPDWPPWTR